MASIRKRGKSYQIRVFIGRDLDGRQISKSRSFTPPAGMSKKQQEKQLLLEAAAFEKQVKTGIYLDGNVLFSVFAEKWLEDYARHNLSSCTYIRYKDLTKRIYPAIGNITLGHLQPHHLVSFYNQLRCVSTNNITGKPLAAKTILQYHRLISSILGSAVNWQLISFNIASRVKVPKGNGKEARFLDENQAKMLLNLLECAPYIYKVMVTTLLYTGLRRSELLGLEWQDIDFANCIISVRRVSLFTREQGLYTVDKLKNGSKCRVIKVNESLVTLLREYRQTRGEPQGRLFTKADGTPLHPDTLTNWFARFIRRTPLPYVTIHSLRHTNATLLIAGGMNLRTVSNRLGHAQASTTCNIYAHAIASADAKAADILQDILAF